MSGWLIAGVGIVYLAIASIELNRGRIDLALTFGGYAVSNIGLWMAAR